VPFNLLLPLVVAMVVTMALIPILVRAADQLHVLDHPIGRKIHAQATPRVGGIAMAIGVLLPLWLWLPVDATLLAYLLSVLILLLFGVWDDRATLSASAKFAGQALAVVVVMIGGHVSIDSVVLNKLWVLPHWLSLALTFIFLVGVTNAINLTDGLDGLAGGTALLCCAALTLLAQNWGVQFVGMVGVSLVGALFGFLRFNTYPARIFMGDAGSQFLGLSLGVLSILITRQSVTPLSTALPLLLIGVPVLDTLTVMTLRLCAGRSPFAADRRHFHYRLMALGLDHTESVIVLYATQGALFLLAWRLRFESDLLILGVFGAFAILFSGGFAILERSGWSWHRETRSSRRTPLSRLRVWLVAPEHLPRWAARTTWLCTAMYLLGIGLYANQIPWDVGALCLFGLVTLVAGAFNCASATINPWLVRGAVYVSVVAAVYLDFQMTVKAPLLQVMKWVFLPLLALSVVLSVRCRGKRRFEATPLDVLLIFAALALPNLPGLANAPHDIGISIAKLVALLYSVELLVTLTSRLRIALIISSALFYTLIAARALL
jgi:UDP-GlcNAc:undecaprenyl-phosphate/decaprenyl-phosphate GlcNAc-1-phosphate transferase